MLVPKLQVFTIQIAVISILAVLKTLMEDINWNFEFL